MFCTAAAPPTLPASPYCRADCWHVPLPWWRRGGLLVYAICSLQPEECERQVDAFLEAATDFARLPVRPGELAGVGEAITTAGDLRTLPCHWAKDGGMDGFYAARLRHLG